MASSVCFFVQLRTSCTRNLPGAGITHYRLDHPAAIINQESALQACLQEYLVGTTVQSPHVNNTEDSTVEMSRQSEWESSLLQETETWTTEASTIWQWGWSFPPLQGAGIRCSEVSTIWQEMWGSLHPRELGCDVQNSFLFYSGNSTLGYPEGQWSEANEPLGAEPPATFAPNYLLRDICLARTPRNRDKRSLGVKRIICF